MENKLVYVLSSCFKYEDMICSDGGPGYALDMGWPVVYFHEFAITQKREWIYIIDNRITALECQALLDIIKKKTCIIGLKVIDPIFETTHEHYYYIMLLKAYFLDNTFLLSTYEAQEIVSTLKLMYGENRFINIPYAYNKNKELQRSYESRSFRMILTGGISASIYPYRYKLWSKSRRSLSRVFIKYLNHAGYKDIGQPARHSIIGDKFIKYISNFRFMILCPSRSGVELLKYRECAYAGCMPLGIMPFDWTPNITLLEAPYLDEQNLFLSAIKIVLLNNKERWNKLTNSYRHYFRETRNPYVLNKKLNTFVNINLNSVFHSLCESV